MSELNYEQVEDSTGNTVWRAEVPGGWLYRHDSYFVTFDHPSGQPNEQWISSIAFVPLPPPPGDEQ